MDIMKIINPCQCKVFDGSNERTVNAFCKITYQNGQLSITGVVGPKSNGDSCGSCGQCKDEISHGTPAKGWTDEMLKKFCSIWDTWHLNYMRPFCEHQKALGWNQLASVKVKIFHYMMTSEALDKKKAAEKAALDALREGRTFTPTELDVFYSNLEYLKDSPVELLDDPNYKPDPSLLSGGAVSVKSLGLLTPAEHPEGILGKACPVCGYKYGTAMLSEEVPVDVLKWLFSLPDAGLKPAWI